VGALNQGPRPRILVCASMWWPLSARLAMAFVRHGCAVSGLCPPGHPLRFISGIESVYLYKGLDSLGSLESAILAARPDLIVPGDDSVVWQLHALHARNIELQPLIERSLGDKDGYPEIRSRGAFLQVAHELGIRIPSARTVLSEEDIKSWNADTQAVLKLDGTCGGMGVCIARSRAEAAAALRTLSRPIGAGTAWKRWLINRDPVALWVGNRHEKPRVTIQEFIQGRPANAMIACWQGEVVGTIIVEVIASQGATGAATVVRVVRNEEIERAGQLIAAKFKLSGFHGLDFILERETGAPYLIELNPRCTQLGHLRLPSQGDLATTICAKLRDEPQSAAETVKDSIPGNTVAFFPQAFNWNPKSPYLRSGYHDVPWEEPALVRELLRSSWPERQWLYRAYHSFRPLKREDEVEF
jgi:hypothetical protein